MFMFYKPVCIYHSNFKVAFDQENVSIYIYIQEKSFHEMKGHRDGKSAKTSAMKSTEVQRRRRARVVA